MTSPPYDVIVIGAGPGGSNAATAALQHGLSVAQVDRHRFPRIKPCGGGVTMKSCRSFGRDLKPVLRGEFNHIGLNVWQQRDSAFSHPTRPLLRMVERAQFDAWLVSRNLGSSGYQFYDDERVMEIEYDGCFRIRTAKRILRGRHLVGADGAYSFVNRVFSIARPKGRAVALEVTLRRDTASLPEEIPPCFDLGVVPQGYGWVFPKDDHWNVGLYSLGKAQNLRHQLLAYIGAKRFQCSSEPLATLAAHQFPYGGYRVSIPDAPVYLVGDAGGFGDAMTGEGIYHALESGRLAADAIHHSLGGTGHHRDYYRRLRQTVLLDTFLSYHASQLFYRNPGRAVSALQSPSIRAPMIEAFAAGASFAEAIKQSGWLGGTAARLPRVLAAVRKLR